MEHKKALEQYRKKRNLSKSGEPEGSNKDLNRKPIFVIQKHDATNLHYDFRLEIDGVLVSWAVPKGPSTDPREKRLAVMTEDHPLEYADFEGIIPKEEYGGGTVLIWDRGTYRNLKDEEEEKKSMKEALEEGHLTVWLEGDKLRGGYALTKVQNDWLLVKMKDGKADARRKPLSTQAKSVHSGRTLEQISSQGKGKDS